MSITLSRYFENLYNFEDIDEFDNIEDFDDIEDFSLNILFRFSRSRNELRTIWACRFK